MSDPAFLENITYAELTAGRTASLTRVLAKQDIELFASVSGDVNPAHMDEDYARQDIFHGVIAHGMWLGALISTVLGTLLPGPGTIYLEQNIKFRKPVHIGDRITVSVTVRDIRKDKPVVTLDCRCINQAGETVAEGLATVLAPTEKIRRLRPELPDIEIQTHDRYHTIMQSCHNLPPVHTGVVHPVQGNVIEAVFDAVKENLIIPILIGPRGKILAAAKEAGVDISGWKLIDTEHSHAAAAKAAELAHDGKIEAIMKGSLHTDELLSALVPPAAGLHTEHRFSHAYVMDVPGYPKPLIISDAAVNIAPDLAAKADITQNAIDLWRVLFGMDKKPKVAILAAVETINPKMQATIDAGDLCKMTERGQIINGIVDGPLAFDNAISLQAAQDKGITSPVAGDADILIVPEIEAGNILVKQLTFLGHADAAGIVLGARLPIILTSRADNLRTRLLSCALAVLMAAARREGHVK